MLCLTLVLPILVLAGVLASFYVASQHAYLDRTGLDAARGAAQAIDRELTGLIFAAEVLAQAPSAQAGNWPEFASYAREFRRELRADIEVHDRAGQQRVNTADAEGATPTARPEGATQTPDIASMAPCPRPIRHGSRTSSSTR